MKLAREYVTEIQRNVKLIDVDLVIRDIEIEEGRTISEKDRIDEIIEFLGQGCTIYYHPIEKGFRFMSQYHWEQAINGQYDYLILEKPKCEI